jgi:hypothetical protein
MTTYAGISIIINTRSFHCCARSCLLFGIIAHIAFPSQHNLPGQEASVLLQMCRQLSLTSRALLEFRYGRQRQFDPCNITYLYKYAYHTAIQVEELSQKGELNLMHQDSGHQTKNGSSSEPAAPLSTIKHCWTYDQGL